MASNVFTQHFFFGFKHRGGEHFGLQRLHEFQTQMQKSSRLAQV